MPETALIVAPRELADPKIQVSDQERDYALSSMAANTRRAIASDFGAFEAWCASVGADPLPANAATVARYLTARAPELAVSTLARHLSSIRTMHRLSEQPVPAGARLEMVWTGIRKHHGRPPEQKRALVVDYLKRMCRRLPDTLRGRRDRAILCLCFAAALRRSELAAIEIAGSNAGPVRLVFVPEGLEIHIGRSKTDQMGAGAIVGVPFGKSGLCPVKAVKSWLEGAKISSGRVFRAVDSAGKVGEPGINDRTVARVIKAAAKRAGLDETQFSGHSPRAGLVTTAAANDVPVDVIMNQTRHRQFQSLRGYIRDADRFKRNAAGKVGL
jgi:site-specific recombinase XerD